MSVRTHYKLIGAAGAAALALSAMAGPAMAAGSTGSAAYTCSTPLGAAHPSAVYTVRQAPATMAVGQGVGTTAKITLDTATTALVVGALGWSSFKGTITTKPSATLAGLSLTIPRTRLGNGAGASTVAPATGATKAGTKVGRFTFKLGSLGSVSLTGFDATGHNLGTVTFPNSDGTFKRCTNNAGTTTLRSGATAVTTKVVKDSTKTTEKASYAPKKKIAKGTATVKARFGTPATGKVTFVLKKGTHTLKTLKGAINTKGVATVSFKGTLAKGKYSITGKYAGSASLKGSHGTATFTVK